MALFVVEQHRNGIHIDQAATSTSEHAHRCEYGDVIGWGSAVLIGQPHPRKHGGHEVVK